MDSELRLELPLRIRRLDQRAEFSQHLDHGRSVQHEAVVVPCTRHFFNVITMLVTGRHSN